MTDETYPTWEQLKLQLLAKYADIEVGKMMSSEALTHRGKVFVFTQLEVGVSDCAPVSDERLIRRGLA